MFITRPYRHLSIAELRDLQHEAVADIKFSLDYGFSGSAAQRLLRKVSRELDHREVTK